MEKEVLEAARGIGEYISVLVWSDKNMKLSAVDRIARSTTCQELWSNLYHAVRIARMAHTNYSPNEKHLETLEKFLNGGDCDKRKVRVLAPVIGLFALSYHGSKKSREGDEE